MIQPRLIIDQSDYSVVVVCNPCGWRCVELSVSEALHQLFRHGTRYDHYKAHGIDGYQKLVRYRYSQYGVAVPADLEAKFADAVSQRHSGPRKPFKPRKGPKAA